MTVADLITLLQTHDPSRQVVIGRHPGWVGVQRAADVDVAALNEFEVYCDADFGPSAKQAIKAVALLADGPPPRRRV